MSEVTERRTAETNRDAARTSHRAGKWQVAASVLGFVGAGLSIWALLLNNQLGDQRVEIARLEQELHDLSASYDVLQQSNEELREENVDLQRALPDTVSAEEIPDLREAAQGFVLTSDYHIDLSSLAPNFGQTRNYVSGDGLTFTGSELRFSRTVDWVALDGEDASYSTCVLKNGWRNDYELDAGVLRATDMCLRLASGRIATIVVTDVQTDQVTLDIAVWESAN